jgi:stage III sporulation protein AB
MLVLKYILLILIFIISTKIGIISSKRYRRRVEILEEFKILLNRLKAKIKFTYEPLPEIFNQIFCDLENSQKNTSVIFKLASQYMQKLPAGKAWEKAIDECNLFLNAEDKKIAKSMGNMLGRIDVDGQINDIDLTILLIDEKIKIASAELLKNEKLYKSLGSIIGIAITIILF